MLTNSDGIIPYNSCSSYLDFDDEELKRYPQLDLGKLWIHLHTIDNIIVLINKFSISFNHECTFLWIIIITHGQLNVNFQGGYNVFYYFIKQYKDTVVEIKCSSSLYSPFMYMGIANAHCGQSIMLSHISWTYIALLQCLDINIK